MWLPCTGFKHCQGHAFATYWQPSQQLRWFCWFVRWVSVPRTLWKASCNLIFWPPPTASWKLIAAIATRLSRRRRKVRCAEIVTNLSRPILLPALGFHGRSEIVKHSECANCHAEHKGRAFKQDKLSPLSVRPQSVGFQAGWRAHHCGLCRVSCRGQEILGSAIGLFRLS